jgi:predicted aconitase
MLWAEDMAAKGAKVAVPTSGNVIGVDRSRDLGMPSQWVDNQMRIEAAYEKMGMLGLSSCTPYFCGLAPKFGDIVAWAESSAVVYVNSILGARDNREGGPSALAAALTGRTPLCGLHLDQNRLGDVLVRLASPVESHEDYGAVGNYVGKLVGERVPVFENLGRPSQEILAAFGAALASAGGVALFHAVGLTPEARTLEEAFKGKKRETVEIGRREIERGYANMISAKSRDVDFVAIGCPHATIRQIGEIAEKLGGRKVSSKVMMWVQTNMATLAIAKQAGYADALERAGAVLTQDLCAVLAVPEALGATTVATNSPKLAFYGPGANGLGVWYGGLDKCLDAAVTGVWPG